MISSARTIEPVMKAHPRLIARSGVTGVLAVVVSVAGAGCDGSWRPTLALVRTTELAPKFVLDDYLAHVPGSTWHYERTSANDPASAKPVAVRRVLTDTTMTEGILVDRPIPEMNSVLQPRKNPDRPTRTALETFLEGNTACIVAFEPPAQLYPESLAPGMTVREEVKLYYYGRDGRYGTHGTVTREVTLEGLESVDTPAGRFEDCLRLRVKTVFSLLNWGMWANLTDYVWLAKGVGEVRRIERIEGAAWIFLFDGTAEYRLVRHEPATDATSSRRFDPRTRCSALLLERGFPRPLVGGWHHELAPPATARDSADAPPVWEPVSPGK
jgi:hypothetical protein